MTEPQALRHPSAGIPTKQVRAVFDDRGIVVYQAYGREIAEAALAKGRFVSPFKRDRMTWIKPSFLWMMYRSGWATKVGQERILRVTITREGFEWALAHSCLSHHDPVLYASREDWLEQKEVSPVRVQWDPDRSLLLEPLAHRAIQIGLGGDAVRRYVDDWIIDLTDVTDLAHEVHSLVIAGDLSSAHERLPKEGVYPLGEELCARIGATPVIE